MRWRQRTPATAPIITAQLTASNTHGAHGPVAESEAVVLGLPDAPTLAPGTDGINPGVGKLTLTWSAPQTNAFIGTKYTLNLYRPANTTAPVFSAVLSAAGTTAAGITTFTQQVQVPAGPYTLEITTANVHGAGDKTALSSEFTVGEPGQGAARAARHPSRGGSQQHGRGAGTDAVGLAALPHVSLCLQVCPPAPPLPRARAAPAGHSSRCCVPRMCRMTRWPPTSSRHTPMLRALPR